MKILVNTCPWHKIFVCLIPNYRLPEVSLRKLSITSMQQPELGGRRPYFRAGPPSSLAANSTDEQFAQDEQTAEVAPACSAEQDIVQTHYSPRGVVLLYFQGDASEEVDKHFNRTFSELYCLPSGVEKCGDGSHLQGAFAFKFSSIFYYAYF